VLGGTAAVAVASAVVPNGQNLLEILLLLKHWEQHVHAAVAAVRAATAISLVHMLQQLLPVTAVAMSGCAYQGTVQLLLVLVELLTACSLLGSQEVCIYPV
jgi:hypothetical protein